MRSKTPLYLWVEPSAPYDLPCEWCGGPSIALIRHPYSDAIGKDAGCAACLEKYAPELLLDLLVLG